MFSKIIFFVAQALLIQLSLGQVLQGYSGNSFVENNVVVNSEFGLNNGLGLAGGNLAGLAGAANLADAAYLANAANLATANLAATNAVGLGSLSTGPGFVNLASISGGGALPVTSYSPIAPGGLAVVSDNAIEGSLLVTGELPFLSAVAFEGALNTNGAGAASCGCASGSIGITAENYPSVGNGLGGYGLGLGPKGFGGVRL